jgi:hypothetical protein
MPFDSIGQNNLAHGVYWMPQIRYCLLLNFGRGMQYPSKFQNICYGTQCVFGIPWERYYKFIE